MSTKLAKQHRAVLRMGGTDSTTGNIILLSSSQTHFGNEDRYYLIPATPEAYEAQVEAMARAIDPQGWAVVEDYRAGRLDPSSPWYDYQSEARSKAVCALAAIGITRPWPTWPAPHSRAGKEGT